MEPILAVLLVGVLWLPFHLVVRHEWRRMCEPPATQAIGVALPNESILEARVGVIGRYDGRAIYAEVQFMGTRYRFDRVAPASYGHRVKPRELYVPPGLVYVAA